MIRRLALLSVAAASLFAFTARVVIADDVDARPVESPRLRALAESLQHHDAAALGSFWQGMASTQNPLIEPLAGRPDEALYTFVWKAAPDEQLVNVRMYAMFPRNSGSWSDTFTRLGDSNVWYVSYALPRAAHLRYSIVAPKGRGVSHDRTAPVAIDGVEYEAFRDPLNHRALDEKDPGVYNSIVDGPTARNSPWLGARTGTPAGKVEKLEVTSRILGNSRSLRIYTPASYREGSAPGLLLVFDGDEYTNDIPTPVILDNLIAAGELPPMIAALVESPDRDSELPPNDDFQRFIGEELLPLVRSKHAFSRDPSRNVVAGASYGGIAAAYTAFMHADVFGNVVSQSGSFAWSPPVPAVAGAPAPPPRNGRPQSPESGWLIRQYAESPKKDIRFFMEAGTWEGGGMLMGNRLMRSVLAGKGYSVSYRENVAGHAPYYWRETFADGLIAVIGRRPNGARKR